MTMNRREEIKTKAIYLFAEKGFHGSSMRDIATACNIKGSSIYNHFESKSDLLKEILTTHAANSVEGLLLDLKDRMDGSTLEKGLHLFAIELVKLWSSETERLSYSIIIKHLDEYKEITGTSYADSVTVAISSLAATFENYRNSKKLFSQFSNEHLAWQFLAPIANLRLTYLHETAKPKGKKIAEEILNKHIEFFVMQCGSLK